MFRRRRLNQALMSLDDEPAFVKAKGLARLFNASIVFELNGDKFRTWWEGKINTTVVADKNEIPVISSVRSRWRH